VNRPIKQALGRAVARVAPGRSTGVRVLLYHAIDDPDPADRMSLRVSRQRFLEQMTLLRDDRYAVVPLGTVFDSHEDLNRVRVAITFDDGYRSQQWAAAVLQEFGFAATFFVVPRFLDGVQSPAAYWEGWGHLRWDDAAVLVRDGFDVGSHSTTHPDLRKCADAQLDGEVSGARALLEQRLGTTIVNFSYPYGRYDRRVTRAVERAGYRLACTSRYGINRSSVPSYTVHRTEVTGTDDLRNFQWKLHGKYDWLGYWQDLRPLP
jgi:peptidoglycan/xylan/chitin deacetylase (PgdA/CDA1 family)